MPINVEINETQAQSNEVKVGQFRTDEYGGYGIVVYDGSDDINFLVVKDTDFNEADLPTINFLRGGDKDEIKEAYPYVVNGKIVIEGYRN